VKAGQSLQSVSQSRDRMLDAREHVRPIKSHALLHRTTSSLGAACSACMGFTARNASTGSSRSSRDTTQHEAQQREHSHVHQELPTFPRTFAFPDRRSYMSERTRPQQASFEFRSWGGARRGAGRKRRASKPLVVHRARPDISHRHPVHVTLRFVAGLESLRKRPNYRVVLDALSRSCGRFGMRIIHYSVMTNHVHMICEVDHASSLSRGLKGLCVRLARNLNARWQRTGRVIADRYHTHVLRTPREVRNALAYVLDNASHHGIHFAGPDPCSSAAWFDGWKCERDRGRVSGHSFLLRARTWLLAIGWRRHGLIPFTGAR